ncbi:clustered mitochondria protein [Tanacetum coccineum]|uniref:Clustered mitochondria protein n=1 Tax=Tanacetum coccineum TaxID=301880 RepID=A0ABQ4X4B2_9ASTR
MDPEMFSKGIVVCKGIVGSDDRHYLLDLMRVTPRDANYTRANYKFCILRPELITAFYQFELPEDARSRVKNISVIRNLCLKVGVSIAAKKYDLSAGSPFQTSDILNLEPVVKHSITVCQEAKELIETGKVQLVEGILNEAYTLFTEAFTILHYLAMVLYHAGDMAPAIMQQHKELIINERCLGLDHPDIAHSYGNMALFYYGLNQSELALRHMSRALLLLSLLMCHCIVSEIRLDTPYGDKWIRRIGVNFLGVRDKIKSIKIITINHIKCVSLTDEQLCIRRIGCSGYAGSGIDHYAFLVLSWR